MKYLIPFLLILASCNNRSVFLASEFNKQLSKDPTFVWKQPLPKELPQDFNIDIDTGTDIYNDIFAIDVRKEQPHLFIYAPVHDTVYDICDNKLNIFDIVMNECVTSGNRKIHLKAWSPTGYRIHWSKVPH